jgi:SAM domain (Sterile alpha motif)/Adenylate and Guanylate cyclase catalytic domain
MSLWIAKPKPTIMVAPHGRYAMLLVELRGKQVATISEWLASLGMPEYAERFADNRIDDVSILRDLTDQDFKDIGVPLGHRRKMLRAIAEMVGTASTQIKSAPASEPKPRDDAERRQLTVMFCDLVGSTALSARLDPEDLRGIIAAYHRCCTELVERNAGFVAKYMGDGVLQSYCNPLRQDRQELPRRHPSGRRCHLARSRTGPRSRHAR